MENRKTTAGKAPPVPGFGPGTDGADGVRSLSGPGERVGHFSRRSPGPSVLLQVFKSPGTVSAICPPPRPRSPCTRSRPSTPRRGRAGFPASLPLPAQLLVCLAAGCGDQ